MAKDPAIAGPVSNPEGGAYPSSEEVRAADAAEVEAVAPEDLTRSEVINAFGEKVGQLLLDGGYSSISAILRASDSELEAISGIGEGTVKKIRGMLVPGTAPVAKVEALARRKDKRRSARIQRIADSN